MAGRGALTLRPFTDDDFQLYTELANESYPDYAFTVEEVRHFDVGWRPEGFFKRRVIAEVAGEPVGYSDFSQSVGAFSRLNALIRE